MNYFRDIITLCFLTSIFISCQTPMSLSEVNELTICENTSLEQVKKNILLAGYKITKEDSNYITTEYKQLKKSIWDNTQKFYSLNIVKESPKSVRYKVIVKEISQYNRPSSSVSVNSGAAAVGVAGTYDYGAGAGAAAGSSVDVVQYQLHTNTDEFDLVYYKEDAQDYVKMKQDICGK